MVPDSTDSSVNVVLEGMGFLTLLARPGASTLDVDCCFLLKSSSHFMKGQNFQVGSDTAGDPLEDLISYTFLVA